MIMKLIIKVTPKANKDEVSGEEQDLFGNKILKIKTTKAPEKGEANKAVIAILAKHFNTAKSNINIISGQTSRTKMVEIKE